MTSALVFLIIGCVVFIAFIAYLLWVDGKRDRQDFDGGYSQQNPPPVRTVIWNGSVEKDPR